MKLFSKIIMIGVSLCLVHVAHAESCPVPCPKEDCKEPCPPPPCPPKPCKPCPPVCFEPGYPTDPKCTPCAYNLAASYELGPCIWDCWIDASFTYWEAYEEGLDLAVTGIADFPSKKAWASGSVLTQKNEYKPGFKIGFGIDLGHDHWSWSCEYTWFRSKVTTNSGLPDAAGPGTPVWLISALGGDFQDNAALNTAFTSSWRLNMDLLDAMLARPYYQGTHLIITPFAGIRGQWIRQKMNMSLPVPQNFVTMKTPIAADNTYNAQSWAVGPRGGFQGKWHLGWGFRFEGDMGGGILYTRYTKVRANINPHIQGEHPDSLSYIKYNTLRFVNDCNLGIGWGSYLDCRNYHFDLLLSYDFQIFWNENMMSKLATLSSTYGLVDAQNLYLHGLTIKAQLDY